MFRRIRRIIPIFLIITLLSSVFVPYGVFAGTDTISEQEANMQWTETPASQMGEISLNSSGGSTQTVGYTELNLDDLLSGTEDQTDTDEDGLPDEVEKILGLDPENADTDQDNLDDYYEADNGLDPLYPDTNRDGLADYYEVLVVGEDDDDEMSDDDVDSEKDTDGDGVRDVDDMDNDGDGVIDGVDLSPFSYGEVSDVYEIDIESSGNDTYVNIQVKPEDVQKMYENNQVYDWPYDTEGNIMDSDMTQDDMRILPMLEVEMDNLPNEEMCEKYGIMLDNGKMYVNLDPVIDRGQKVAYEGKIFIPAGNTSTNMKIKLTWTLQAKVDNASYKWEELPSTYGGAKEYISAGAATGDIDDDGFVDVVVSGIEGVGGGRDRFYYSVSYKMELDGSWDEFTGIIKVPVDFPEATAGSGIALGYLDNNDTLDVVCMAVESIDDGADRFVYTIGYNLDKNGISDNWTPLIDGPVVGYSNQGAGLDAYDLDDNGKAELVFMTIDDPDGANAFRYTIRWNFDPNATDAYDYNSDEYSELYITPSIGHHNQGGSLEVVNLDGDDKPDLLLTCVDNPDRSNSIWYYVAWDINTDAGSADRGKYASFSEHSRYDMALGSHSGGFGTAVGDFDKDGKEDIILIDVDDPRGKKNEFWYWIGDTLQSDGSVESFSEKQVYSGIKGGLHNSLNRLDRDQALALDCAVYDLDGNGIDDLHMVWVTKEGYTCLTTGWDLNEDGQVRGWQNTKVVDYGTSSKSGLGLEFYDVNNDNREDLIIAYYQDGYIKYRTLKGFSWRGGYSYTASSNKSHNGVLVDLRDDFDGIDNLTSSKISGVGVTYKDVDDDGKLDVVVSYNKSYSYYVVTKEEGFTIDSYGNRIVDPEERRYYYITENRVDVLYRVEIPNSVNDNYLFSYEDRDRYILHTYEKTEDTTDKNYEFKNEGRQTGVGAQVGDFNGDGLFDIVFTSAVTRNRNGEFYYIIQYDFLSDDSELQILRTNDKDDWNYNDIKIRGVGMTSCNFDSYNVDDAIAIIYDDEEGFRYFKNENIETKTIPILKEYEPFVLVGIRIEENKGAEAGILYCDLVSTTDNDLLTMSTYEVLRGHYLKDTNDIEASVQIVKNDYDIDNITLETQSFDHADEVAVYLDENTSDLFEDAAGTHVPIIISVTNESRALTLDAAGILNITDAHISFDLADASYSTNKMLQLKWYDAENEQILDSEDIVRGINSEWGWDVSDDETKMNAIGLLTYWDIGEIKMVYVDSESVLPQIKVWGATWWAKVLPSGASSIKDIVNYSRQGYQGLKVVSKIWGYSTGITGFAKNITNYYKLMNGVRITDATVWRLKNALDVDTFTGIKNKFTTGSKMSKISKWGMRTSLALDLGIAIYRGNEISNAYASEGAAYSTYAGAVYTLLKGGYSTMLYLIPIISKLKYGAAGTGVGTILVALIELSDLITFLACGEGWSTMVIGKIFNALVGVNPDVEVSLELTNQDMTYDGMENGLYVVGSTIENEVSFYSTVEDIDKGYYDAKSSIDNNYARPIVEYDTNVDGVSIDNNRDIDTSYRKRDGLWWVYKDYDLRNVIEFENIGINVPIISIFNIYTKIHIHKKGAGDDYYEKDSDINRETLYFDVLPTKLDEFRAGFNFDTSYEGGAEVEPLDESKQRAIDNEIVIVDEDGDGLLTFGKYEKNSDGDLVESDPTKADTDGDGIDDNFEDALGSDPSDSDSDNDGLNDRDEMLYRTDLNDSDTDNDGLTDKQEIDGYNITVHFNGRDYAVHVSSDPLTADTDGDGIDDEQERADGTNPAARYTNGQKLMDGNDYDPSMKQPLPDIADRSNGEVITIDFDDYFEDLDGDTIAYTVDVGELNGSVWTFTYGGGLVEVTVLAEDGRDGDWEEMFVINDTLDPYITATYFDNNAAHTDEVDGASGVAGNAIIRIEYNENIVVATSLAAISLVDEDSTPVPFSSVILDNVLTINPEPNMSDDGVEYVLTIPNDCIKDLNENVTPEGYDADFATRDIVGPIKTSSFPPTGSDFPYPVLTVNDPVTFQFHESLMTNHRYPAYIGLNSESTHVWDLNTVVDSELGSFVSYLKPDTLLDNTLYRFYASVRDQTGNFCDSDYIAFMTGDVTSPDLLLPAYYSGDATIKYMMKVQSPRIEIPYDENIFEGVNFSRIVLEDTLTHNLAKPILSRFAAQYLQEDALVQQVLESELTTLPIDVQIDGNMLVITVLSGMVPNCMYSLVIPKDAVSDAGGLSVPEQEEIRVTLDDNDNPEVYSSGFTKDGEIRVDGQTFNNPADDLYIVFNEGVRANNLGQITLADSSGNNLNITARLLTWFDDLYGAGVGQSIAIESFDTLNEHETYTLTVPAGTVKNIMGFGNSMYTEEFAAGEFSMPAIKDETFAIIGNIRVNEKVYGHYIFEKYNELFEGLSTYQWYSGFEPDGGDMQPIPGADGLGYRIGEAELGKYLFFEVTPALLDGSFVGPSITLPIGPIEAAYSPNNDLALLEVKDGATVVFSETPDILNENEVLVGSVVTEVTVKALQQDDGAHVELYFDGMPDAPSANEMVVPLSFGSNLVTVTVTDERGTNDQRYTLMIERDTADEHLYKPDGYCEIRQYSYAADGKVFTGSMLLGDTYYYDDERRDEGESEYRWYKSHDASGADKVLIGEDETYTPGSGDVGYYIFFEYTPVTDSGIFGDPYLSDPTTAISGSSSGQQTDLVPDSTVNPPAASDDAGTATGSGDAENGADGAGVNGAAGAADDVLTADGAISGGEAAGAVWYWYVGGGILLLLLAVAAALLILKRKEIINIGRKDKQD